MDLLNRRWLRANEVLIAAGERFTAEIVWREILRLQVRAGGAVEYERPLARQKSEIDHKKDTRLALNQPGAASSVKMFY